MTNLKVRGTKGTTHVFAILDMSGSMSGLEKDTIGGYNSFIKKLKGEKIRVTLTCFDTVNEIPYSDLPIKEVPELDEKVYSPRGGTALVDAVCQTINQNKGKVKKGDKALVLIITDGEENSSREYSTVQMKKLISGLEEKGNWTFTYLGANQDAFAVAQRFGMRKGNVSVYQATERGTGVAFASMSVNTQSFARGDSMNLGDFYEKDQEKLENAE